MKLKSVATFTGIYLIRHDIVHVASVRQRVWIECQGCF